LRRDHGIGVIRTLFQRIGKVPDEDAAFFAMVDIPQQINDRVRRPVPKILQDGESKKYTCSLQGHRLDRG
jgi:hypothetical protein